MHFTRIAMLLCIAVTCHATGNRAKGQIQPSPEIQAALEQIAAGIRGEPNGVNGLEQLAKLIPLFEKDETETVRQLILFQSTATDVDRGMTPYIVLRYADISEGSRADAAIPLLDDPKYRKSARKLFTTILGTTWNCPDFSHLTGYLRADAIDKYPAFVELIYGFPSAALIAILKGGHELDDMPVLWADHVISDAIWKHKNGFTEEAKEAFPKALEQLNLLASDKRWWVRLYVPAVLREDVDTLRPQPLLTPELVNKLLNDEHASVRRFAEPLKPWAK